MVDSKNGVTALPLNITLFCFFNGLVDAFVNGSLVTWQIPQVSIRYYDSTLHTQFILCVDCIGNFTWCIKTIFEAKTTFSGIKMPGTLWFDNLKLNLRVSKLSRVKPISKIDLQPLQTTTTSVLASSMISAETSMVF